MNSKFYSLEVCVGAPKWWIVMKSVDTPVHIPNSYLRTVYAGAKPSKSHHEQNGIVRRCDAMRNWRSGYRENSFKNRPLIYVSINIHSDDIVWPLSHSAPNAIDSRSLTAIQSIQWTKMKNISFFLGKHRDTQNIEFIYLFSFGRTLNGSGSVWCFCLVRAQAADCVRAYTSQHTYWPHNGLVLCFVFYFSSVRVFGSKKWN